MKVLTSPTQNASSDFAEKIARIRTHRNNIHRYRALLRTKLNDVEKSFLDRRLAAEQIALETLLSETLPVAFPMPKIDAEGMTAAER